MNKSLSKLITLSLAVIVVISCGTIIQGSKQDVSISSSPTGAMVTIDNQPEGETPVMVSLLRKDHHTIKIELNGYQPYETILTRKVSGWVAGNIIFGGLVGLAVDAITGGMYKLTPEQVEAQMNGSGVRLDLDANQTYITFVLKPESGWEKIGTLTRQSR